MKMRVSGVLAVLLLVVGAVTANAQSGGQMVKYNVPFDFAVGNEILPQGEYMITNNPGFVELRGLQVTTCLITSPTEKSGGKNAYELDFHQLNGQYFLATIWIGNDLDGRKLRASKREREMTAQLGKPVLRALSAGAR